MAAKVGNEGLPSNPQNGDPDLFSALNVIKLAIAGAAVCGCFLVASWTESSSDATEGSSALQSSLNSQQDGLVWFESKDGKWGFRNAEGRVILEPKYDEVRPFSEGLAAVNLGAKKWKFSGVMTGGKWGYVNQVGKLVIPIKYKCVYDFSEGLANVYDSDGTKFIDQARKVVISLGHTSAGDFHEGVAPIYIDRSLQGSDWLTRFIDRKGKTEFTVNGYAKEFHEGMAVIIVRGG